MKPNGRFQHLMSPKRMIFCLCFCLGILAFSPSLYAAQSPAEAWVVKYNGPGSDRGRKVAVDAAGNIYVMGTSDGDYLTLKYAPNGNLLWKARYDGGGVHAERATAMVVDGAGNVYVTGISAITVVVNNTYVFNYDYVTVKYDTNGNQLWLARSDSGPQDLAAAITIDGSGNVYVTGESMVAAPVAGLASIGFATAKYDSNGNQLWLTRYDDISFNMYGGAIAVDGSGNVYVTGPYSPTVKFDSNGNLIWVRSVMSGNAIAVDGSGNVYITGWTNGYDGVSSDYGTVKFDSNGNQLWLAGYIANSYNLAQAIALDGSGNVYITGYSRGSGTGFDYATVKYDPNGTQLCAARYNNDNGDDWATALTLDGNGNVYVTGNSASGTTNGYATVKYDANCAQLWNVRYEGAGGVFTPSLANDGSGNIYVTGFSPAGSGTITEDIVTIKYTQPDSRPDLIMTQVLPDVTPVVPGGSLPITDTVKNLGGGAAGGFTIAYHLSTNILYGDADDIVIPFTRSVSALAAGASNTATGSLPIPAATPIGSYYVCAKADSTNTIVESDESANTLCSSTPITINYTYDLIMSGLSTPTKFLAPGENFSLLNTVTNRGNTATGPFVISFSISTSPNWTYGGGIILGTTRSVPSLGPGASSTATTVLTVPATTPLGTYLACAKADSGLVISETDENNNTACTSPTDGFFQVTLPDLIGWGISFNSWPPMFNAGGVFPITDTVENRGMVSARGFSVSYLLSANTVYGDSDDIMIPTTRSVIGLAAGALNSATTNLAIPASVPPGTYYLCMIVDLGNTVPETYEANNVSCAFYQPIIRVDPPLPDLIMTQVTPTLSGVSIGSTLPITDTVRNVEPGSAGPFTISYRFSSNAIYGDSDDIVIATTRSVSALAAGALDTATVYLAVPGRMTAGSYYVCAKADSGSSVNEINETNNAICSASKINVVLNLPADSDGDALSDIDETYIYHTNPNKADTDGDGYQDGVEVGHGSDPLNSASFPPASAIYAYVADQDAGSVTVVNTVTRQVVTRGGSASCGVTVSPDKRYVYAADNMGTGISILSTATHREVDQDNNPANGMTRIAVGGFPCIIAFLPNGSKAYVTVDSVGLVVLNTGTFPPSIKTTIPVTSGGAASVAVTPNGQYAYVTVDTSAGGGELLKINTATELVVARYDLNGSAGGVAISPNGATIYVGVGGFSGSGGSIFILGPQCPTGCSVPRTEGPYGVTVRPDGRYAYFTTTGQYDPITGQYSSPGLLVLDTAIDPTTDPTDPLMITADPIVATVPVGFGYTPKTSPNGSSLYVAEDNFGGGLPGGGTLAIIDTALVVSNPGSAVVARIPINSGGLGGLDVAQIPIPGTATNPFSDLLLTTLSTTATPAAPGKTLSLSNTVKNQGIASVGSFVVSFHLSLDAVYGGADDIPFTATRLVTSLAAGTSSAAATTLTVPSTTPLGSYYLCAMADSGNTVSESDENNNTLCTNSTIQVTQPDLVISAVTPNASTVNAGATLSVTNTASNPGLVASGSFVIAFRLSLNSIYGDGDDVVITTTRTVASLAAGASNSATTSLLIPVTTLAGDYYVCAKADSGGTVIETDETLNTLCSNLKVTVPPSDLIVSAVSTTATVVKPGSTVSVTNSIKNQGGSSAGSSVVAFRLSTNAVYGDGDDIVLTATRTIASVAAGATSSAATSVVIPATTPLGPYYICAKADSGNTVSESNEGNNTLCTPSTIQVTQPDLVISAVTPNVSTMNAGATLSVTNTASNPGLVASGSFVIAFRLSVNTNYGDGDDVVITTTRTVASIAAGGSNSATTSLVIPATTLAGDYYVCAKADSGGTVIETNETNNTLCSTLQVTVPPSDLIVSAVSTTATVVKPGGSVSVTNSVKNQGGTSAGSSVVAFRLSTDAVYGNGDDIVLTATRTIASVGVGATSTVATSVVIPATTPLGPYYICAKADSGNTVSEGNETNNTLCTASPIQVTQPDLVISAMTPNAATVNAGATLSVTNTASNPGLVASGSFVIAYHLSLNSIYGDGDDVVITTTRTVASLAAGASNVATTSLVIPATTLAGVYNVCAKADSGGTVIETDETNNTLCSTIQVTVP